MSLPKEEIERFLAERRNACWAQSARTVRHS
jgi:hypothetical protein